ncbi:MAG: C69 family dipeptidase [Desulfobacterales bacterium]
MCDTFVVLPPATIDGSVIFGKNSDREPNEAQALEFHPAGLYSDKQKLECTYIRIPQARETYAVILSRPFWMWGAEMGINEKGLAIGNEAVWTKIEISKKGGLTGMDLVRLALERSESAEQALETITGLLSDYGQGGICGYEDKKMAYHNSFIMADHKEAWVLETAGHFWAAKKVKDYYSISNGLTIGEDFDRSHPELIDHARKKGWHKKGVQFNFAKSYSDWFFTTFSASRKRRGCSTNLINSRIGKVSIKEAFRILRDHGGGEYSPDSHFLGNRICAHAANSLSRNATQTTGSVVARLKKDDTLCWATGTSAPCTSVFKPVWFYGDVIPDISRGLNGRFNPEILWWHHELLHRSILSDYETRIRLISRERDELEDSFIKNSSGVASGKSFDLTLSAFKQVQEMTGRWMESIKALPVKRRPNYIYRKYWEAQNRKAGMSRLDKALS